MSTASVFKRRTSSVAVDHPSLVKVGQAGWLAKGVVYVLAGVLVITVVLHAMKSTVVSGPKQEASPTGAIKEVAGLNGGRVLLVVLGVGLLIYALWRVLTAVLPGGMDAEAMATRVGYLVSAILYATFAITALSLARQPAQRTDGNQQVKDLTARVLSYPFGRFVVGAAGVIALGAGIYRVVKGAKGDVTAELNLAGLSPARIRLTKRLGVIGEVGRGIAVMLIGFFLVRAAMTVNAQESTGLDGALTRLSGSPWGQLVVTVVAVGFLLYGMMCIETFRHRTLRAP